MAGSTSTISIEVRGAKSLSKALKLLGEKDAPFLREAMEDAGRLLEGAVESRAPGGMASKTDFVKVSGTGGRLRALGKVRHPGSKSMEFGRRTYYRGYTGRAMKATGTAVKVSGGQKPRPFVGIIKGDHAIAEVRPDVQETLMEAFEKEFYRLASEGD